MTFTLGNGTTVVSPVRSSTVVLPVPGIRGAQGLSGDGLTPEELEQISDEAAEEVLEDLEPPIDLTLLFENALA